MWAFFRDKDNREVISWVCGGLVAIVGTVWAVFTYFIPVKPVKPPAAPQADCTIVANQSLAACRDIDVHGNIVIGNNDKSPKPAN
jgi:hypothetical protein